MNDTIKPYVAEAMCGCHDVKTGNDKTCTNTLFLRLLNCQTDQPRDGKVCPLAIDDAEIWSGSLSSFIDNELEPLEDIKILYITFKKWNKQICEVTKLGWGSRPHSFSITRWCRLARSWTAAAEDSWNARRAWRRLRKRRRRFIVL